MSNSKKSTLPLKDPIVQRGAAVPNKPQSEQFGVRTRGMQTVKEVNSGIQPASSQSSLLTREKVTDTRLLTLQEAADRLAISLPTIRSWVWQRKIEIVKIGRCVRIREQVISELIFRSTIPPMAKA
jgi:excisionase family DNA binding protein